MVFESLSRLVSSRRVLSGPSRPLFAVAFAAFAVTPLVTAPLAAQSQVQRTLVPEIGAGAVGVGVSVETIVEFDVAAEAGGWNVLVCHDPAVLSLDAIVLGSVPAAMNGGSGPFFFQEQIEAQGYTVGAVVNALGAEVLPAGTHELQRATYTTLAAGTSTLCPCPVGSPVSMTEPSLVQRGVGVPIGAECATLTVVDEFFFVRGDANASGGIDIADVIVVLTSLFIADYPVGCVEAMDTDDNGTHDISDGIALLNYLFQGGPPPAAPFPACGSLPNIDCDSGANCP